MTSRLLHQGTHNVANLQKIMTRIGGVCLVTIGVWCIIELAVQFGHYKHSCYLGIGESSLRVHPSSILCRFMWMLSVGMQLAHTCVCGCAERCPTLTNMLVIIVGGIPIAMPTVLSVTLALGAFKLARVRPRNLEPVTCARA